MASRRRPRRVVWILVVALLLWLLLDLNRWLPGVWPGGGGDSGSRPMPSGSQTDPSRLRPDASPPPPPAPQRPTLRIVVSEGSGTATPPSRVTARAADREAAGTSDGGVATLEGIAPERVEDLSVARGRTRVFHGPFPRGTGAEVVVAWPRAALPDAVPRAAGPVPLRVTGEDGTPLRGAEVHVTGRPGEDAVLSTDAEGRAEIALPSSGRVRICASVEGFGEACIDASRRASAPLELRLPRMERREARFVDPETGAALRATAVRLRGSDGVERELPPPEGGFERLEVTWPRTLLSGGSVEVEVAGRPTVRAPLATLPATLAVPVGRTLELRVAAPEGGAAGRASVSVRWAPEHVLEPREADLVTVKAPLGPDGTATVPVPAGRAAELIVEPEDAAPVGQSLPAEATGPVGVSLAAGVALPVRVETVDGKPVSGAQVVALARAGKATVRRRARTGDDGTATLPPVGEGRLEVYAHRPGFSWSVATVDARPGAGPVRLVLAPGKRLRLVVEDPEGLPLAGVAVRAVARADAAAGTPDPMDPEGRPWTTDADGILFVEDLPDREVDLYLGLAGYQEEVVARVRPGATTWFATLVRNAR